MENKNTINGKLLWGVVLVFCLLNVGCFAEDKPRLNASSIPNPEFFDEENYPGQIKIPNHRIQSSIKQFVYFDQVYDPSKNMNLPIMKVVDQSTFDWITNDDKDRVKIDNNFYLRSGHYFIFYFKDNNYIYTADPEVPILICLGSAQDYALLGGLYVRVGESIYYEAKKIVGADAETFKTFQSPLENSEWSITYGVDKNYIYNRNDPIRNYDAFIRIFNFGLLPEVNELKEKYFPNEK